MIIKNTIVTLTAILLLTFIGCNKPSDQNDDSTNDTNNSTSVSLEGTIYWSVTNKIKSLNLKTNTTAESQTIKFSSAAEPIAYDSGFLYTANRLGISCVDAASGNVVWERQYSNPAYNNNNVVQNNSVVLSEGLVYVIGHFGSDGQICLYAMDKRTGEFKWQRIITGSHDFSAMTTPLVYGNQIFALGNDKFDNADDLNKITSLNKYTGAVIWDKKYYPSLGTYLSAKDGLLFACRKDTTTAFAINIADGEVKWKTAIEGRLIQGTIQKMLLADNELVVHSYDANTITNYYTYLDYKTGLKKGSLSEPQTILSSWVKTDKNYIAAAGLNLTAFDKRSHTQLWKVTRPLAIDRDTIPNVAALKESELLCYNDFVLQYGTAVNPNIPYPNNRTLNVIYVTNINTGKTVQRIPVDKTIYLGYFTLVNQNKAYYTHRSNN